MLTDALKRLNPALTDTGIVEVEGQRIDLNRFFAMRKIAHDRHAILQATDDRVRKLREGIHFLKTRNLDRDGQLRMENWLPVISNQYRRLSQELANELAAYQADQAAWQDATSLESRCAEWLKKHRVRLDHGHFAEGPGAPLKIIEIPAGQIKSGTIEGHFDSGGY